MMGILLLIVMGFSCGIGAKVVQFPPRTSRSLKSNHFVGWFHGLLIMTLLGGGTCGCRHDTQETVHRIMDEKMVDSTSYNQAGRRIHYARYEPLDFMGDRSSLNIDIHTYEFNDTSVSLTYGIETTKIAIDTRDSFFLYSLPRSYLDYQDILNFTSNLNALIFYGNEAKIKLPDAKYDGTGIMQSTRSEEWAARFSKNYVDSGVKLVSDTRFPEMSFEFFVKCGKKMCTEKAEAYHLQRQTLPPFVIYSLADYFSYFGSRKFLKELEPEGMGDYVKVEK